MAYAFIQDGKIVEYPLYEGDIKLRHRNTSFISPFVPPDNYAWVEETRAPEVTYTQIAVPNGIEYRDGAYVTTWRIENESSENIQHKLESYAFAARDKRNKLLLLCDWTQTIDAPVNQSKWQEYRSKLRDITKQSGFPVNIDWPEIPT